MGKMKQLYIEMMVKREEAASVLRVLLDDARTPDSIFYFADLGVSQEDIRAALEAGIEALTSEDEDEDEWDGDPDDLAAVREELEAGRDE